MASHSITFRCLLDAQAAAATDLVAKRAAASAAAALRSFRKWRGLSESDPIDGVLGLPSHDFDALLTQYEAQTDYAYATIAPYRSRLREWNALAHRLLEAQRREVEPMAEGYHPEAFAKVLKAALQTHIAAHPDADITSIARALQIPPTTLRVWSLAMRIPPPTDRNIVRIRLLEQFLDLRRDSLIRLIPTVHSPTRTRMEWRKAVANKHAHKQHVPLALIPYKPTDIPSQFHEFWESYITQKTTIVPIQNMAGVPLLSGKGRWRVLDNPNETATGAKTKQALLRFIGWLKLPTTEETSQDYVKTHYTGRQALNPADIKALGKLFMGHGLAEKDLSLGHLLDPELLGRFLEWQKVRHGTMDGFLLTNFVLPLIADDVGFLTQQPEYIWNHKPFKLNAVDQSKTNWKKNYKSVLIQWQRKCKELRRQIRGVINAIPPKTQAAKEKLTPILKSGDLMGVINAIIQQHAASRPVGVLRSGGAGSIRLAIWVRDQLLLHMLASNPLRNRNFREMTWRAGNSGNLYQTSLGEWRLRFEPSDFKNERGAAKIPYDVPVPTNIWPLISEYIFTARPILVAGRDDCEKVFLTKTGKCFSTATSLSSTIFNLTGRFMDADIDILGIRSHAFRHIIATAWLKENPKDYLTVAHILHDKLETVIENYGHTDPADGLTQYHAWVATTMPPVRLAMAA